MRKFSALIFMLATGLVFIYNVPLVKAQDTGDYEFTLEEITVTAQKREENQQKVAIAMDVVTGDEIKELGLNDIDQILSGVTGALVNKTTDGLRVTLRGISQDAGAWMGAQSSAPTVAVNTDGVYSGRNSGSANLYDMERVEVLLGPQSTLYATNSPGGIVNIITTNPKTDQYEGSGSIEYGNFNLLRTEGAMNAPISDKMAIRTAFSTSVRDGYLDNGADNEDSKSARIKTLYKANEKLSFLLTGEISRDSSSMGFGSGVVAFEDQDDVSDPWTVSSRSESESSPNVKTVKKITGRMDLDLGFGSLVFMPDYSKNSSHSNDSSTFGDVTTTREMYDNSYEKGVEMRMTSSPDFFFTWIAGGNWYKSHDLWSTVSSDGSKSHEINDITSKAVYANSTYPVTDRFRISGGFRYTWEDTYQYYDQQGTVYNLYPEYHHPDYMAGIEFDVAENSMAYMSYATGYRTQSSMSWDGDGNEFPHETLTSYTIGSKNRFFDNKLQLNASAFFYNYQNYPADNQIATLDQKDLNGDGDYSDTDLWDEELGDYRDETQTTMDDYAREVADLYEWGFELSASSIITQRDILDLSVSYLRSEFQDLYFNLSQVTRDLYGLTDEDLDFSGKEKTNSPHWTIDLAYRHNFPLWNGGILTARFDSRFQTAYLLTWKEVELSLDDDYNSSITDITDYREQEAYHLSNISMIYTNPDGKWSLTGYVKNLENYAVKKAWISGSMTIGAPRTYGGILSVKF